MYVAVCCFSFSFPHRRHPLCNAPVGILKCEETCPRKHSLLNCSLSDSNDHYYFMSPFFLLPPLPNQSPNPDASKWSSASHFPSSPSSCKYWVLFLFLTHYLPIPIAIALLYKGEPPKLEFIYKNCVFILKCLNCIFKVLSTYRDFFTAQTRFELVDFDAF